MTVERKGTNTKADETDPTGDLEGAPTPPPLPTARVRDMDDISTIPAPHPAATPVKEESYPRLDDTRPIADILESADPTPNPIGDEFPSTALSLSKRPLASRKAKVFAGAFAVAALSALGLALFWGVGSKKKEPAPKMTAAPPTVEPIPPSPQEAYEEAKARAQSCMNEIGGDDSSVNTPGFHLSLLQFMGNLQARSGDSTSSFSSDELTGLLEKDTKPYATYDQLWKLGMIALDEANRRLEQLEGASKNLPDPSVETAFIEANRKWITEWLLGTRGVYCQLRERYWEQHKNKNPPLDKDQKDDIRALRKERRAFLEAAGYPVKPMYEYCERGLLTVE